MLLNVETLIYGGDGLTLPQDRERRTIRQKAAERFEKDNNSRDYCLGSGCAPVWSSLPTGRSYTFVGNMGWIHLGKYQPWLPLAGLEYGFILGIIIGVIVAMKKA